MLSKISLRETKENNRQVDFSEKSKKIIERNNWSEIRLTDYNLDYKLAQRTDAFASRFCGDIYVTSTQALKTLGKALKQLKQVQRIAIECQRCQVSDEGLKAIGEGIGRLNCLKSIDVGFIKQVI